MDRKIESIKKGVDKNFGKLKKMDKVKDREEDKAKKDLKKCKMMKKK